MSQTDYEQFEEALKKGVDCDFCGRRLAVSRINLYPHDGGIFVPNYGLKQWVSVQCSNNKCRYEWSWRKILRRAKNV